MSIYKIVYTLNDDPKRYCIDFEVVDRKAAIKLLLDVGRTLGLSYKIVSCRKSSLLNPYPFITLKGKP
jgi:hypothetical protein